MCLLKGKGTLKSASDSVVFPQGQGLDSASPPSCFGRKWLFRNQSFPLQLQKANSYALASPFQFSVLKALCSIALATLTAG